MPKEIDSVEYDFALAAALVIVEMLQTNPYATTPELMSFITYTCLEAIYATRSKLGDTAPINN